MDLDPSMERMRALLSSYYGVVEDTETAVEESKDIDKPTFDMVSHVQGVLRTKTLPELVTMSDELVNETKTLDVSMQNLVYENYNKFIAATDTIRQMKDSVSSMDDKMKKLLEGMDEMTDTSAMINAALSENRSRVEKLVGVRRLMKKLEFLFELPVRLNRSIELEAYAQAVKYYNMASGVLAKYDHVPSLHNIRVEADDIISKLKDAIRASLKGGKEALTDAKVVECITLLVNLGEPRGQLRDLYLRTQQGRLQGLLSSLQSQLVTMPELKSARPRAFMVETPTPLPDERDEAIRQLPRNDATAFVQWVNESFLDQFVAMADTFVRLFEQPCGTDFAGNEERKLAHSQLVSLTKELFSTYFGFIKRRLAFPQPEPLDPSVSRFASLVAGLNQVLGDSRTAGQCVREARIADMAAEAIERIIRVQVETVFSELRDALLASLTKEQADMNAGGNTFELSVPMLSRTFHLRFDTALESCSPLVLAGMQLQPEMARQFAGLVQGLLLQTIEWLAGAMEAAGTNTPLPVSVSTVSPVSAPKSVTEGSSEGDDAPGAPPAREGAKGVLLLACATRMFEQKNLREVLDGFVRALPSRDQLASLGVDLEELQDLASLMDEDYLSRRMLGAGETLLKQYVMLQSERLGTLVKKSLAVSDWLTRKEPRDARPVVDIVIGELSTLRQEAASALGEKLVRLSDKSARRPGGGGGGKGRYDGGLSLTGTRGGGGGLHLDIERLFNQKQKIVDAVSFNVTSLVEGVLKGTFKTLVECIRVATFGKHGFQQMQVDAAVWLAALPYLVENTRSAEELLNEAVASAGDRCFEPLPMERSIVQTIVDGKLAKLEV